MSNVFDKQRKREFGRRLQAKLNERGWNQSEFARRCEAMLPTPSEGQRQGQSFGRDNVSNYIRGETLPRPPALAIMARVLGCATTELFPALGQFNKTVNNGVMIELTGEGLSFSRTVPMSVALKVLQVLQGIKSEARPR
jgi:transcriptional regulator with XRE-family HTH domain